MQGPTEAISDTPDVEPKSTEVEIARFAVASGWQAENPGVTAPTYEVPDERTRVKVGPGKRYINASRVWGITGQLYIHWATPSRATAALAITAVRELCSGVIVEFVPFDATFAMPEYLVPKEKSSKELILQDVDQEHTITVEDVDGVDGAWKKSVLQITTKDTAGESVNWRVRHLLIRCPEPTHEPTEAAKLWRSIAYLVNAAGQSLPHVDHDPRYHKQDGSNPPVVLGGTPVGTVRWVTAILETLRYSSWLQNNTEESSSGYHGSIYPPPEEFDDDPYIRQLDAVGEQRGWTYSPTEEEETAYLETMWGYKLVTEMASLPAKRDRDTDYFVDWPSTHTSVMVPPEPKRRRNH